MKEIRPITNPVVAYNPHWPDQFLAESKSIVSAIGDSLEIHHIGSTAIAGLSAKPEIDILLVIPAEMGSNDYSSVLGRLGYRRGQDLSIGHQFYKKEKDSVRTHKLHICVKGHTEISDMLDFRDHLRRDESSRKAYQELKLSLAGQKISLREYLERKAPFIHNVLSKINRHITSASR